VSLMPRSPLSLSPSAEHGATLMELLVAMLCSIIVLGALLAILEFSLGQEARVADDVQADQIGRTAMTKIVEGLHSSCVGNGATAIQLPSPTPKTWTSPLAATNRVNLWFLTAYGSKSAGSVEVNEPFEHDINWHETGKTAGGQSVGTLTDYVFAGTGTPPTYSFPEFTVANAKAQVLAKNVIAPSIEEEKTLQPTIFRYADYNNNSAEPATYGHLKPLLTSSEISAAAKAEEISAVTITFTQASESGNTETNRTANLSDSIVLRFNSAKPSEVANGPCE